jgi:hypothetical protein
MRRRAPITREIAAPVAEVKRCFAVSRDDVPRSDRVVAWCNTHVVFAKRSRMALHVSLGIRQRPPFFASFIHRDPW